jgi:hypothetical protein
MQHMRVHIIHIIEVQWHPGSSLRQPELFDLSSVLLKPRPQPPA